MVKFEERLHCHGCNAKEHVKHYCFFEGENYLKCSYNRLHQIDIDRQLPWFHSEPEGKSLHVLNLQLLVV